MTRTPRASRLIALTLVASLALPTLAVTAGCGSKNNDTAPMSSGPAGPSPMASNTPVAKPGLSGKQKLVLLAGAALLFYIYQKDKANNAAAAAQNGGGTTPDGKPQLYREDKGPNKGAIYYRKNDANHTVVWLKAPAQGMQVPADQVQQYLPDYGSNPNAYQSQVNTNPQAGVNGGTVQSADQYAGAGSFPSGPGGPPGPGQ